MKLRFRTTSRPGGIMLEIMAGLALLVSLTLVLLAAQVQGRTGSEALAAQRHALRVAERALDQLRQKQTPPATLDQADVTVEAIPDLRAPAGQRWVWVRSECRGRRVQLAGMVPQ